MDIQEIGQSLLNELQEEVSKSNENAKLAQGAIQGVQLFFTRLQEAQTQESPSVNLESGKDVKSVQKRKKVSKTDAK